MSWHKEVPFPFLGYLFWGPRSYDVAIIWSDTIYVYFTISNPDPSSNDSSHTRSKCCWSWGNFFMDYERKNPKWSIKPIWSNLSKLRSMILPTGPLGKYPKLPLSPPQRKEYSFINCWWNVRGIFQGYVGEILEIWVNYGGKHVNSISHMLLYPTCSMGLEVFTYEFTRNFGKKCSVNIPVPYSIWYTKYTNPTYNTTTFHTLASQPTPFLSFWGVR